VDRIRILIADDHELVRQGIRTILAHEPSWVVCGEASNGHEALEKARELNPDLILLDVALPELDGVEVTRQIRSASSVPIIIVSMHDYDRIVRDAIDAGANGYVLKADAGRTLADAVRAVLSQREFFSERVRGVASLSASDASEALAGPRQRPLTAREREVLRLLAAGQANKEVAAALGITTKTAETHRARIMAKLNLHSISDLVRYAIRNHIIEP
jgi:DNA-binding NarL/FixJ family response regulator